MNRFYLQDALVGSHSNFKNANDYVKRAKGAIAMHTQPFKDVSMEFIVFEDIGDKTDGGAYITQEQAKHINNAFSDVIDVGEVYKFVYYGKEQKNQNPLLFNKTTYGKFNVHTISKEEENKNEKNRFQNILGIIELEPKLEPFYRTRLIKLSKGPIPLT